MLGLGSVDTAVCMRLAAVSPSAAQGADDHVIKQRVALPAGTRWQRARQQAVWATDWMWPHLKEVASVLTVTSLYRTATHTLPTSLRSWSALRAATK